MTTAVTPTTHEHSVLERLRGLAENDPVLCRGLGGGLLWAGNARVEPSGPDRLACAVARLVVMRPESAVALAVPRGAGPLPALLGLYLALWRKAPASGYGRLVGSVAISTRQTALRELGRELHFDGSRLDEAIGIARLVGLPIADQKKVRAAALELRTRQRDFLDQQDSWLLFCLPNVAPPVAFNVISAMVVDTVGASEGSWEQTYERNVAARRRQVWVGELGDGGFEAFCEQRRIPLLRMDWALLRAAAEAWGAGTSPLASAPLARRALDPSPIGASMVRHEEIEFWLMQLQTALHEMQVGARFEEAPEVFGIARWAAALLARTAYPLGFYEAAAARLAFSETVGSLIERVEQVSSSPFRGRWKPVFHTYWTLVKGSLQQLLKLIADADVNPKWWALQARVEQAVAAGEPLRVLCQTRAERIGLRDALYAPGGLVAAEHLDRFVTVSSFSQRAAHGSTDDAGTTVLLSPPPERFAGVYLAGEAGRVEVLCYSFELRRLRLRTGAAVKQFTDPSANHAALDALGLASTGAVNGVVLPVGAEQLVVELDGWQETEAFDAPDDVPAIATPGPDDEFWERALELRGTELPGELNDRDNEPDEGPEAGGGESTRAVLVAFVDAPPKYFREDAEVTVITRGEDGHPEVAGLAADELEAGMRIAVLPGSERGSLLSELMGAWDEQLALVRQRYMPMYRRALSLAEVNCGGADALARHVGLTTAAIRTWLRGHNRPQQPVHLRRLLEASGDAQAIANQAVIHDYFSKTRGAHRVIGRVLNEAVEETVLHGAAGGESLAKLQELVGMDLADLFDNVHVLRVAAVSNPRDGVPAGVCGSFLDLDDPYIRHKGAL